MLSVRQCVFLGLSIGRVFVQAATDDDDDDVTMGPAAFMWPADRPWAADHDNISPCGSSAGVGNRTNYPLSNGRLALVVRDDVTKVHISVAYDNDPSEDDFTELTNTDEITEEGLDQGHSCFPVPDPSSSISAGSNATFRLWYEASPEEENGRTEDYYACADVTFVEQEDFSEAIPCFNATEESPGIQTDPDVEVTLTSSGSESESSDDMSASGVASHIAEASEDDGGSGGGLSKGGIAGVVIGSIAGAALLVAAAIFWLRYRRASAEAARAKQAAVSKFDIELAPSTNSGERARE